MIAASCQDFYVIALFNWILNRWIYFFMQGRSTVLVQLRNSPTLRASYAGKFQLTYI